MQTTNSANAESAGSAENVNLRHYWHVVLERRWLVITAFISIFVLCLIYLYKAPKIFQASVRVQIDPETQASLNLRDILSVSANDEQYLQTQYKNLTSRSLVESVYKSLMLSDIPRFSKRADPLKALNEEIIISPLRLSRLVDIKVEDPDPKLATALANALADAFIQQNLSFKADKTAKMVTFLRTQATNLLEDVRQAEQAIQDYREETKIVSLDAEKNTIYQALALAQAEYAKSSTEARYLDNLVEEVDKHVASGKPLETFPTIANDGQVKQAQVQLAALENELAGLLKHYKDKHPNVITCRSKIANAREAIAAAVQLVAETMRSQARVARSSENIQSANYQRWEAKQQEWNKAKMHYDVLNRQAQTTEVIYNQVLGRMKEIELVGNDKANNIRIIDHAFVPYSHVKPRVLITLLLGVMGGLGIAVGLAFFVNYIDDSVKSQDDVETYLRLPFLGYVPNIKSNSVVERDLQAHLHPQSNAAEAFRTIRAALSLSNKADRLRLVSVTSTIPSEGKSLAASNLAIVLAQTGLKSLLVDADLRRPSVHKTFQLHSPVGLAAYLMDKVQNLDELIHTTEVPNLDVICCGATPQTPSEHRFQTHGAVPRRGRQTL